MSAGTFLAAVLLVGVGGGAGSVLRWGIRTLGLRLVGLWGRDHLREEIGPWTTVPANVLACFVLGVVVSLIGSSGSGGELMYMMLAAGFCGGLSTLSTAASDVIELVRRHTFSLALAYLLLSAGVGMAALWLGLVLAS